MSAKFIEYENKVELIIDNKVAHIYKRVYEGGHDIGILHNTLQEELTDNQVQELLLLKLEDMPPFFDYLGNCLLKGEDFLISINNRDKVIGTSIEYDLYHWDFPFSFFKFAENIKLIGKENNTEISIETDAYSMISILNTSPECKALNLIKQFEDAASKLLRYQEIAIEKSLEESKNKVFSKIFEFPNEYKNICTQYLIWFGEFLKRLGIDANVSTEQKKIQTVLIVSPEKNIELLGEIEQLFYRYIDLPYMEYIPYDAKKMNTHQKYQMDSLLDEIGDYQHKLKKAMRNQRLLEAENDDLLEEKIKLKTTVKELEKDKLLLKSSLKDPKKNEIFSCLNKSFALVGSVSNNNDLIVGLGIEIKPTGIFKEVFNKKDKSNSEEDTE